MSLFLEHVSFRYRRSSPPVLSDFSWSVPQGRTVLLGPNGAGKPTLLPLAADALRPAQGTIRLGSLVAARRSDRAAYRRAVGWMPQHVHAVPGLTAREQVAYAAWLKGMGRNEAWASAAVVPDQVGLMELASQKTSSLSGGQLRRVGLAQVLVHNAKVMLLDEPTVGLDPTQRGRFREILASLSLERPIVVSTHQVDDLSELFDTVVVLERGSVRFEGSVSSFLDVAHQSAERRAEAAYAKIVLGER